MAKKRIGANQRLRSFENRKKRKAKAKSIKRPVFTGLAIFCFVIVLGSLIGYGVNMYMPKLKKIKFLTVRKVKVKGNEKVPTDQIVSLASINKGDPLFGLNSKKVKVRLQQIPQIGKVSIHRSFTGALTLEVLERKPIALVNLGTIQLMDKTGTLWPLQKNSYWSLPLISGVQDTLMHSSIRKVKKDYIKRITKLLGEIAKEDVMVQKDISQICFEQDGMVSLKFGSKRTLVRLSEKNIGPAIKNVMQVFKTVDAQKGYQPHYINMCYSDLAFVK